MINDNILRKFKPIEQTFKSNSNLLRHRNNKAYDKRNILCNNNILLERKLHLQEFYESDQEISQQLNNEVNLTNKKIFSLNSARSR
jgi:hypothetical protein